MQRKNNVNIFKKEIYKKITTYLLQFWHIFLIFKRTKRTVRREVVDGGGHEDIENANEMGKYWQNEI